MKLYKPITVDLYNTHPLPKMNAQQHNVGRGALVTLTANGAVINPSEETVRFFANRPDGNVSYLDCVITEDRKIQLDFTDQMLAVAGQIEVEIQFTTTETNITTPIFIVENQKSNIKDAVESSNEFIALETYAKEAKEAASIAKEGMATVIVTKHAGETILTTDSANTPLQGMRVFGKNWQNTVAGNQLAYLSTSMSSGTQTKNGVTATVVNEDNISLSGTCETNANITIYSAMLTAGKECTISGISDNIIYVFDTVANTTLKAKPVGSSSVTFTANSTGQHNISVNVVAGTTYNNVLVDLMLNSGTAALAWEPYVGGIASPNPLYPQDIHSHGEGGSIGYGLYGKNLADVSLYTVSSQYLTLAGGKLAVKKGRTYTISATVTANAKCQVYWNTQTKVFEPKYHTIQANTPTRISYTFVALADFDMTKTRNILSLGSSDVTATCIDLQLEEGKVATDVVEFTKQSLTLQTPNGLNGLPVSSGGNWTDANGQQWICDEVDLERGKYVQRVQSVVIDGTKGSDMSQWAGDKANVTNFRTTVAGVKQNGAILSTHLLPKEIWGNNTAGCRLVEKGAIDYTLPYSVLGITREATYSERVSAMKAWTTENPITFYAELATPIETDLTEEEIAQYKALLMNYPNTTIINDAGAYTEIEQVCDTKIYVDSLKAQNEALEARVTAIEAAIVNS